MSSQYAAAELAEKLKAVGEETRLQMLLLLAEHKELCVCDFEHTLGITQSKASRHLRHLYHAGMVEERREGVWIHYRLADGLDPRLKTIVLSAREALDAQILADLEGRLRDWLAVRTCCPGGSCASH